MGNPDLNSYVPFKVAYKPVISNKELTGGFESLNPNITACNVPVNVSILLLFVTKLFFMGLWELLN